MAIQGILPVEAVPGGVQAEVCMSQDELQAQVITIRELTENIQSWNPIVGYPLTWEDKLRLNANLVAIFAENIQDSMA